MRLHEDSEQEVDGSFGQECHAMTSNHTRSYLACSADSTPALRHQVHIQGELHDNNQPLQRYLDVADLYRTSSRSLHNPCAWPLSQPHAQEHGKPSMQSSPSARFVNRRFLLWQQRNWREPHMPGNYKAPQSTAATRSHPEQQRRSREPHAGHLRDGRRRGCLLCSGQLQYAAQRACASASDSGEWWLQTRTCMAKRMSMFGTETLA